LQAERHIEIFGYVGLRPEFFVAVFVVEGDLLDGRPAEYRVVTDEGCYIAVGDSIFDGCIDEICEECDAKKVSKESL
jgi:hypothetical protein